MESKVNKKDDTMEYTCIRCGYTTTRRVDFERHQRRKIQCNDNGDTSSGVRNDREADERETNMGGEKVNVESKKVNVESKKVNVESKKVNVESKKVNAEGANLDIESKKVHARGYGPDDNERQIKATGLLNETPDQKPIYNCDKCARLYKSRKQFIIHQKQCD